MNRIVARATLCAAVLALLYFDMSTFAAPRTLTVDQRVAYQRRLEELARRHRLEVAPQSSSRSARPAPDEAALRAKVLDGLEKSRALERVWQRPLSAAQLRAELLRMARATKAPSRLREIFAALDDDPFIVAECLARPALADRLVHNAYAADTRLHGAQRAAAERALQSVGLTAELQRFGAQVVETTWVRDAEPVPATEPADGAIHLDPVQWDERMAALHAAFGRPARTPLPQHTPTALRESTTDFSASLVLEESAARVRVVTARWAKVPFETWWSAQRAALESESASAPEPASIADGGALPRLPADECSPDRWRPTMQDVPDPRFRHSAVWTGQEMIVWGGASDVAVNTGGRYDPATDTWTGTSTGLHVPGPRYGHTAVWTGTSMIVWGGFGLAPLATGGRYDPATDTWTEVALTGAPAPRYAHVAGWTGSTMLVWGGLGLYGAENTGGRYDAATNTWSAMGVTADTPSARYGHTGVWTGHEFVVWGGVSAANPTATGGRYDPATDTWSATGTGAGAPAARFNHTATWSGDRMLVWGGANNAASHNTGSRYDPLTDTWSAIAVDAATPSARQLHTAVWTGHELVVWGGVGATGPAGSGSRYDPATDSWTALVATGAPVGRSYHTAVWTGSEMLVWGGAGGGGLQLNSGARYSPAANAWVPTAEGSIPAARYYHSAVWTGAEMIVWGGTDGLLLASGGRYDPAVDDWTPTSTGPGTPTARTQHTAVWTGTEMIVWGGSVATGARYDPATDTWTATGVGAATPSPRRLHTAVWTGSAMLVWGGYFDAYLGNGARYEPLTDTWTPITNVNAPSPRLGHTAVWTGSAMLVWGGDQGGFTASGSRYDPATDAWTALSASGAPSARYLHTAVWSGREMLVWGGYGGTELRTGARYDPATDAWVAMSVTHGTPSARHSHTAAWTGTAMVVWGGYQVTTLNTGARYEPATDRWIATGLSATTPTARQHHTAIAFGDQMLLWGGSPTTASGAVYCALPCVPQNWYRDGDGDGHGTPSDFLFGCTEPLGYVASADDCNDANAAINPGLPEVCDANYTDENCNGAADDADPGALGKTTWYVDADGDGYGAQPVPVPRCHPQPGQVAAGTDCDDTRAFVFPGAPESANCIDDDCNGQVDDGLSPLNQSVTPALVARGTSGLAVTVTGSAFACAADVLWTDVDGLTTVTLTPTLRSATSLTVAVPPALLDTVGTALVRVRDPLGTDSAPRPFHVLAGVSVPSGMPVVAGTDVVVPVLVDPVDGVHTLDLTLTYDTAVLAARAVYTTALTHGMSLSSNVSVPGTVHLVLTAPAPLSGAGEVAWILFHVDEAASHASPLHWVAASLDSGAIESIALDGSAVPWTPAAVFSLPDDASGAPDSDVVIPLRGSGITGATSADVAVRFDANLLHATGAAVTALTAAWTLSSDVSTPGLLVVHLEGAALTGDGEFATLSFHVPATGAGNTPLDLRTAGLNGGALPAGTDDGLFTSCVDMDHDGWTVCGGDCNDHRADVNPGRPEIHCNGLDDDCSPATPDVVDADGDGWDVCSPSDPADGDGRPRDCDDAHADVHPGAAEFCNLVDDNCDGQVDENPAAGLASCTDAASGTCQTDLCADQAGLATCVHASSGACTLAGVVRYYRLSDADGNPSTPDPLEPGTRPVPGVRLDASGYAGGGHATTAADGRYAIPGAFGSVTLAPAARLGTPRADETESIGSEDAAVTAKSTVGLATLTPLQQLAADVTGNNEVSAFDASLIAQYAVELIDHFPVSAARGSDWAFVRCDGGLAANCPAWPPYAGPASYAWNPLLAPQSADFYAVLYGEVTGNWPNPLPFAAPAPASAAGKAPVAKLTVSDAPRANAATLYVADGPRPLPGGAWRVVLGLRDADGIQALDMHVEANPSVTIVSLAPVELAAGYGLVDRTRPGGADVALYGTRPMHGSGAFLALTFRTGGVVAGMPFRIDARANEGLVPLHW